MLVCGRGDQAGTGIVAFPVGFVAPVARLAIPPYQRGLFVNCPEQELCLFGVACQVVELEAQARREQAINLPARARTKIGLGKLLLEVELSLTVDLTLNQISLHQGLEEAVEQRLGVSPLRCARRMSITSDGIISSLGRQWRCVQLALTGCDNDTLWPWRW